MLQPPPGAKDEVEKCVRVRVELVAIPWFEKLGVGDDRPERLLKVVRSRVGKLAQVRVLEPGRNRGRNQRRA